MWLCHGNTSLLSWQYHSIVEFVVISYMTLPKLLSFGNIYHTRAIISHGLYIFYPTFHCGLYCRAVSVTDNLCTRQGNSSIFGPKIESLKEQFQIKSAHCFVQDIKVAFDISSSIWQKKIVNRFEQFWVEIYLKKFVRKIQNHPA